MAGKGTIFLDEIQQLSPQAQAKLLRVAESGEVWPLGAAKAERPAARSLELLLHADSANFSHRHVIVSTCGLGPNVQRSAKRRM